MTRKPWFYLFSTLATMTFIGCLPGEKLKDTEKGSYSVGVKLAQRYKELGLALDSKIVARAIDDVNMGRDLALSPEEMKEVEYHVNEGVRQKQNQKAEENLKTAKEAYDLFLKEKGVKRNAKGFLERTIKKGSGKSVQQKSTVVTHYTGRLSNGLIFDSSVVRGRPAEFRLNNIIPGLREALLTMKEGDKKEFLIPPELGYGSSGSSSIPANSALKFELEVIKVK